MRLIDADALKDRMRKESFARGCRFVDEAPTADAIPRGWWEQLRTSIEDLRDNNEYDTDSDMFQTMKVLANMMKVIEGKHEVD